MQNNYKIWPPIFMNNLCLRFCHENRNVQGIELCDLIVYQLSCLIWPEMKLVSFIMCIMHHVTLFLKNAYGYGNASCIRYQLYSLKNSHEYAPRS